VTVDVPLVSVIIPTRNRLAFLEEAVRSVIRQTLRSCEIIVVDDASSDGTPEWLTGPEGQGVTVVRLEENSERSRARNRGLERARGTFVLFLDDDDRLRATALENLHQPLAKKPGAIGAVGGQVLFNERGQRRRVTHPRRSFERTVWLDLLAGWMTPPGTVLWRTETIRLLGGFNENITRSEDRELFLRASRLGSVVFIPQAVLDKRSHSGQFRPASVRERQARWTAAYVQALPPEDRPRAEAAMQACTSWNEGRRSYGNLRPREAVSQYFTAVRTSHVIVTSPLLRRTIVIGFAKSLLGVLIGRRGLIWARHAKRSLLHAVGRDVQQAKRETKPI
jgi:glycosyltransferase involved in cell wall biosynthesis